MYEWVVNKKYCALACKSKHLSWNHLILFVRHHNVKTWSIVKKQSYKCLNKNISYQSLSALSQVILC